MDDSNEVYLLSEKLVFFRATRLVELVEATLLTGIVAHLFYFSSFLSED